RGVRAQPHEGLNPSARTRRKISPPHSRQVCSTTVLAGCAPPAPQKPRSLRACHAVGSPATSTRSLDARSPPTIRAQKRVSPRLALELDRGKAPHPEKRENSETNPRPRGCPRPTTRR